jgi:Heparinase II/III-like protein
VLERTAGLDGGPVAEWQAAHHGYRRLRPPAVHRRSIRLDRRARQLVIEDRLETASAHNCRLAFHLGPDVACTLDDRQANLEWPADRGRRTVTMALPDELVWQRLEGHTDAPAGWYSPSFGVRVPTVTLLGTGRIGRKEALITVLQLNPGSTS